MEFSTLATYFKRLEETPSRNAMTELLAEVFRRAKEHEIGKLCYLLQGRVGPLYESVEFGMAEKFIIRSIMAAYGPSQNSVVASYKKLGDIGSAAQALHTVGAGHLSVVSVYDRLREIALCSGQGSQEQKITLLADILRSNDALSARYIARIPLDKLRLGFSEMTILDALSWMLAGDKSLRNALEDAYNLRPDIGYIAETVKRKGIAGLSHIEVVVGSPVLAQLCQRLPNADEMIKKMGEVAVEPKYDGVRVQIHIRHEQGTEKIRTFSRNLENTTGMFPELSGLLSHIHAKEVILDCEAVGIDPKTGKITSFQETTTRKRKHGIDDATKTVPLHFFVFDVLYKDGKSFLSLPLSQRREMLEKTVKTGRLFSISPQIVTSSPDRVREYHDEQIKKGLEGVVVKKWESPYEPGRRGYSWVKFKEEEGKTGKLTDTIDAVVMGYYVGEGKRTSFGIGALLVGIKKGESFVTVTKIGTGVSDELWKSLQNSLSSRAAKAMPKQYHAVHKTLIPDFWVVPELVVEVAGDDLTKSPTHGAGYAIRFPRLVRVRHDKSASQATTERELTRMFLSQAHHIGKRS